MSNPHKGRTGLDRVIHAAGYSWAGLKAAYTGESAFRQEVWLVAVATPLAFWLGRDWVQVALLLGSVLGVMRTTPSRWLSLSDSIDRHRVEPEAITAPVTLVGFTTDRLCPPSTT